jgi:protocatechuate 3,4-dioxygenase alpha subunit
VPAATPSQTVGPFFSFGLCAQPASSEIVPPGSEGALEVAGRVLDGAGDGVPDALVEIWQADADGSYRADFGWSRCGTSASGDYGFVTIKPGRVPADDGTPQAPHLNVLVFARGLLKPVYTRMYFVDEEAANEDDPVLAALARSDRSLLIAPGDGSRFLFDIRLQGEHQTPFFAL